MSKLSDERVVERLARRLKWRKSEHAGFWFCPNGRNITDGKELLTSRDALAPVLAGLSDAEWRRLLDDLVGDYSVHYLAERFLLTIEPQHLARATASAIGEPEVGKEGER